MRIICSLCGLAYPEEGVPIVCPVCQGVFDYEEVHAWLPALAEDAQKAGIWRYAANFGLASNTKEVSLGEGNTPLVWSEVDGKQVGFKCEFTNPSGSYKDRGASLLVSFLLQRGVHRAIEDSSGNAGAAFAAYMARANMQARVYMPAFASGAKAHQIAAYGAEVVRVPGTRQDVADETLRAAKNGAVYASHAYLAHVMAGYATIAYELVEQLGAEPASVIVPAGQGSLLLGIGRGFISLQKGGKIKHLPQLIGVQAKACAPLACLYHNRHDEHVESFTLAEGVRIPKPLRAKTVVEMVKQTRGDFIEVNEEQLMNGYQQLARRGLYVEPTSALVWEGLMQSLNKLPSPIICILTGSGLKWIPAAEN